MIEVILVLSVISVLLLLSPPIKPFLITSQSEKQFLTRFENDLLYMQSISYQTNDYIGMDILNNTYTIKNGLSNKIILQRKLPDGWKFDKLTLQGLISFNRNGAIRESGTIHLYTKESSYKIVFPLGKGRCYIEKR